MRRSLPATLLLVLTLASTSAAPVAADAPIRIASMPIDSSAEAYFAQDMGFFKNAGITATIDTLPNGAAIAAAVMGGSYDIGFSNLTSIAAAVKHGLPLQIISPGGLFVATAPTTLAYVQAGSPIKRARDLAGKTVAISGLKNSQEGATRAWVDQDGGDGASVKIVDIPFPEEQAALAAGRVDCIFVAEPALSRVAHDPAARYLGSPYTAISKQFLIGGWFATKSWLAAHRTDAVSFASAMRATAQWANTHPSDSAPILAKCTSVPLPAVLGMTRAKYGIALHTADIQPELDNAAKYGLVPPTTATDLTPDVK